MRNNERGFSLFVRQCRAQAHLHFAAPHHHQRQFRVIWTSPKVFITLLRWKLLLSKWSYQNNRRYHWVSSSSVQHPSARLKQISWSLAPKWIRALPHITSATQNVGAETSFINLAGWSPSLHIFSVLCFQSQSTSKTVWHAQTPLGWLFSSF